MIVSTGPSEYMCRRKGGKDRDKGQRQGRGNTVQGNRDCKKLHYRMMNKKKPFGCFVFVKDTQMTRQNLHRFSIFFLKGG